jgi:hypothetical protein
MSVDLGAPVGALYFFDLSGGTNRIFVHSTPDFSVGHRFCYGYG